MAPPPIRKPIRILGIDPGLRRTGWGVIESEGNRLTFVGCGSVEPPDDLPLSNRLLAIHEGLAAVLGDDRLRGLAQRLEGVGEAGFEGRARRHGGRQAAVCLRHVPRRPRGHLIRDQRETSGNLYRLERFTASRDEQLIGPVIHARIPLFRSCANGDR